MKNAITLIATVFLFTGVNAAFCEDSATGPADGKVTLDNDRDKISYAIGMQIVENLTKNDLNLNPQVVLRAISDVLNKKESALNEQEVVEAMTAFQAKMQEDRDKEMKQMEAQRLEVGGKNLATSEEFLQKNAKEEGVVSLPSGLQYKVVEAGSGPKPGPAARVRVHYRGSLLDGTQFDSSYDRNEPAVFRVNQVIPGWQEALQLMAVGSKYQLFIPPSIAYGESGNQRIPPNSLLLFDVELLEVLD